MHHHANLFQMAVHYVYSSLDLSYTDTRIHYSFHISQKRGVQYFLCLLVVMLCFLYFGQHSTKSIFPNSQLLSLTVLNNNFWFDLNAYSFEIKDLFLWLLFNFVRNFLPYVWLGCSVIIPSVNAEFNSRMCCSLKKVNCNIRLHVFGWPNMILPTVMLSWFMDHCRCIVTDSAQFWLCCIVQNFPVVLPIAAPWSVLELYPPFLLRQALS